MFGSASSQVSVLGLGAASLWYLYEVHMQLCLDSAWQVHGRLSCATPLAPWHCTVAVQASKIYIRMYT